MNSINDEALLCPIFSKHLSLSISFRESRFSIVYRRKPKYRSMIHFKIKCCSLYSNFPARKTKLFRRSSLCNLRPLQNMSSLRLMDWPCYYLISAHFFKLISCKTWNARMIMNVLCSKESWSIINCKHMIYEVKCKLALVRNNTIRLEGKWEKWDTSQHFLKPQHEMEVSDQLHFFDPLTPRARAALYIGWKDEWAPETVWTLWTTKTCKVVRIMELKTSNRKWELQNTKREC